MSLESQIAALVSAANSLTSQVAGKLDEIDQKTNAVASSITDAIKDSNSVEIFIDQQNGSDENDGVSVASALKTISSARNLMMPGGLYRLKIIGDYLFNNDAEISPPTNASIWIDGGYGGKETNLICGYTKGLRERGRLGFIDLSSCSTLYMRNVKIGLDKVGVSELLASDPENIETRLGFLKTNAGLSTNVVIGIRFENVDFSEYLLNAKELANQYGTTRKIHFAEGVANLLITMFRICTFPADLSVAEDYFYADRTIADYSGKLSVSNISSNFRG
ncbi:hypothetical protein ACT3RU_06935 [Halomonas sp. TP35]